MDELRSRVIDVHADAKSWSREDVAKGLALGKDRKTRPYYTRYEWTHLLSVRVHQLKAGAAPLVGIEDLPSGPDLEFAIATKEALQQKLPFVIVRNVNGQEEFWSAQELTKIH